MYPTFDVSPRPVIECPSRTSMYPSCHRYLYLPWTVLCPGRYPEGHVGHALRLHSPPSVSLCVCLLRLRLLHCCYWQAEWPHTQPGPGRYVQTVVVWCWCCCAGSKSGSWGSALPQLRLLHPCPCHSLARSLCLWAVSGPLCPLAQKTRPLAVLIWTALDFVLSRRIFQNQIKSLYDWP